MKTDELLDLVKLNTGRAYDRLLEMEASKTYTPAKLRGLETFLHNAGAAATTLANRAGGEPEPKHGD